ncbi:ABC transporter permease [Jonesia quinghaiensis]|uniref:ABC transporter permease n=1 Tax=Jonesia quinghaiensis TaxID=262806 RepID=UPI0003FE1305|nr:ABC transporter permease [Jonesia quinghaiensis]
MSSPHITDAATGAQSSSVQPSGARVTGRPGIPFTRLLHVEFRKLFDTRAARILIVLMLLGALGLQIIEVFLGDKETQASYQVYFGLGISLVSLLVPVIAILATTAEWSQRTALATFMWEPRRVRVLAAKGLAALVVALVSVVVVAGFSAVTAFLGGTMRDGVDWSLSGSQIAGYAIVMVVLVAQGIAFGALLHNTAAALVTYFVAPLVLSTLTMLVSAIRDIAQWVDINIASVPILEGDFTTDTVAKYAVSIAVWVVLPGIFGVLRTVRREVK